MTQHTFEIRWWIFEEIENRANKYNWALDCEAGEETTYSYKSMIVYGQIIGETEKAYKVSLNYTKWNDKAKTIYEGFIAWIPKKAIVNLEGIQERRDAEIDEIMGADLLTYTSCGIE